MPRLRLENGRKKDVRPPRNWQVGDVIEAALARRVGGQGR